MAQLTIVVRAIRRSWAPIWGPVPLMRISVDTRVGAGSPALLTVMEPSGPSVTVGAPAAGCFVSPVAVVGKRSTTVIFVVREPSSSWAGSRRTTRAPSRWPETAALM